MISAIILTKNSQNTIVNAIESASWCDEVIVIDDQSIDNTVELAKNAGATVFSNSLEDNFANQRNFGLQKAQHEWVLFIDSDEQISEELHHEIKHELDEPGYSGYYLRRIDTMWGKVLNFGETSDIKILRLAKKKAGKWEGAVHEVWDVMGKTKTLHYPILHFPHPTVADFLSEINFYSTLRAKELYYQKKSVSWLGIILYPKAKFFVNFVIKQGFRDGMAGIICAIMMSFHSFLVRAKLWLLWHQTR